MNPLLTKQSEYILFGAVVLAICLLFRFSGNIVNFYKSFTDQPLIVDPFSNGVKYAVSYWTERGGRPYQEDRLNMMKGLGAVDSSLYGVFDGHGGYKAAQYCKEVLLQSIIKDAEFEKNPAQAIFNSFYKYCKVISL